MCQCDKNQLISKIQIIKIYHIKHIVRKILIPINLHVITICLSDIVYDIIGIPLLTFGKIQVSLQLSSKKNLLVFTHTFNGTLVSSLVGIKHII